MKKNDLVLCYDFEDIKQHGVVCHFSHYNEAGHTVAYHRVDTEQKYPIVWRYSEEV